MALEKMDGIHGAYVNNGISLHLASKDDYHQDKIAKELKAFKLSIKESKLLDGSPFVKPPNKKQNKEPSKS